MRVFILTYCPTPDQLYGNLPALRTARIAFPSAEINIIDNCSCPEASDQFRRLSQEHGYRYGKLNREMTHQVFMRCQLNVVAKDEYEDKALVFCDPDIAFFTPMQDIISMGCPPDELRITGDLWPGTNHDSEIHGQVWLMPRLHTSLLYISDAALLKEELDKLEPGLGGLPNRNPWSDVLVTYKNRNMMHDTGAVIYEHLPQYHHPFTPLELGCYEHLINGCHSSNVLHSLPHHQAAKRGDYEFFRGMGVLVHKDRQKNLESPYWEMDFPNLKP
jgi:hypothetical protein